MAFSKDVSGTFVDRRYIAHASTFRLLFVITSILIAGVEIARRLAGQTGLFMGYLIERPSVLMSSLCLYITFLASLAVTQRRL